MNSVTPHKYARHARRGILAMIFGGAFFVFNDVLVKLATSTMPIGQLLLIRGLFAIPLVIGFITVTGNLKNMKAATKPIVILRAACEVMVTLTYITAIAQLPIGDITSIMQATPIIMTILCAVLGIELVDFKRWLAVIIGFAGVLLITQPGGASFTVYSLIALASATFVAIRDLITRRISNEIPPQIVILTTTIFATFGGVILGVGEDWRMPTEVEFAFLGGAAVMVSLGNALMVTAYRNADIAILSPLRYLVVVWAAATGIFIFGERPGLAAIIGTILVVGSGLFMGYREQKRSRLARGIDPHLG
ncbi:MAG: DMT family transporter [Hyphomicrobiales bacterium]